MAAFDRNTVAAKSRGSMFRLVPAPRIKEIHLLF